MKSQLDLADKAARDDRASPASAAAQDDAKLRKLAKLEDNRPLSPAELYRALNDALDEGYDCSISATTKRASP